MRNGDFWITGLTILALAGCGGSEDYPAPRQEALDTAPQIDASTMTELASGLSVLDVVEGDGDEAMPGQRVTVHYTGWFLEGEKFDSSLDRGQPFPFALGAGHVIAGWDEGVAGMRVGGWRRLVIPPKMAYGEAGRSGIPPNSTLVFDVELVDVEGG